jgi:very-short-patch-repair endonuclease
VQWWAVARAQSGVISTAQLAAAGRSPSAITRMARRGELERLSRGVYLAGGAPATLRARLWAAVLATDGVLGYATAGALWGVLDPDDPRVHVVVPAARRVSRPSGVVLHRHDLPPAAVRVRADLPTTSRPTTVLDLLASLPAEEAGRLADRALQRHWLERDAVTRRLAAEPRRPGNAQLRRLADQLGDGAAAHSERLLHRLLRGAGIRGWIPNHEIWAGGELIGVVDVALPHARIAIEVDGMAYHVDVDRFRRDRARQNALVALGWTVLRFTWADLTERPGYVVATIRQVAA